MLNFKQYLIESTSHLPTVIIHIEYTTEMNKTAMNRVKKDISRYIKEEYKISNFSIEDDSSFYEKNVIINDIPQHLFDTTDFVNDITEIIMESAEVHNSLEDYISRIECQWPPAYKITVDAPLTIIKTTEPSIKGIEKLVEGSGSNELKINIIEPIGILSLLKIKGFKKIGIFGGGVGLQSIKLVNQIFHNHYSGDKNILACQEELMDNGLKEYAKF